MEAMARRCNTISFASKVKLYKSLATSILYGCETWTLALKNDGGFPNQVHEETSPYLLLGAQDQRLVQSKINSLVVHWNLFRQLSRDGNLHGSGMSH